MSHFRNLSEKQIIKPPKWISDNIIYECITGSVAYGVSSDTSDMDVYGICIPKKEEVFPHLSGKICGFDKIEPFEQYIKHQVHYQDALNGKGRNYDFTIFSIIKFFKLGMENNPNILDILYVPRECILSTTQTGELIRENRKLFLHKGLWPRFKGYAYSQLHKIDTKDPEGSRKELIEKHGYDVKFGYHLVRLLYEAEMLISECDMDLQKYSEHLKSVRRGDVSLSELKLWAKSKEKQLEDLVSKSKLPQKPQVEKIKQLLLDCLESHYGQLNNIIENPDKYKLFYEQILELTNKV